MRNFGLALGLSGGLWAPSETWSFELHSHHRHPSTTTTIERDDVAPGNFSSLASRSCSSLFWQTKVEFALLGKAVQAWRRGYSTGTAVPKYRSIFCSASPRDILVLLTSIDCAEGGALATDSADSERVREGAATPALR